MVNQTFHVLNQFMEDCPVWVPGQLYIGGAGLARGYWRDRERTGESFIVHPLAKEPLYRTGDLGRYLPDGNIEFLGREDFQVKIRGYRIELGEIESVIKGYEGINDAVVIALDDSSGGKRLVGYVVPGDNAEYDAKALQAYLAAKLPDYMIPPVVMALDALPLTPNGKIDRKSLPRPGTDLLESRVEYIPPGSDLEKTIGSVIQEILGINKVGIRDNLFDIGANSLHMLRIQNRLEKVLQMDIPVIHLFEHTTIESLARYLSRDKDQQSAVDRAREHAGRRKRQQAVRKKKK